jgi:hypothetical protein
LILKHVSEDFKIKTVLGNFKMLLLVQKVEENPEFTTSQCKPFLKWLLTIDAQAVKKLPTGRPGLGVEIEVLQTFPR